MIVEIIYVDIKIKKYSFEYSNRQNMLRVLYNKDIIKHNWHSPYSKLIYEMVK